MELSQLMDQYLGAQGGTLLYGIGPGARMLHDIFQSEAVTSPLIATTFWQAFIESPDFAKSLWSAGASHAAVFQAERYIVSHGTGWPRQDLVVFDPDYQASEPIVALIKPVKDNIIEGWERFRQRTGLMDPHFRLRELAAISQLPLDIDVAVADIFKQVPQSPKPDIRSRTDNSPRAQQKFQA